MVGSLYAHSLRNFSKPAGPTTTEIHRIRYTICNLKKNCSNLEDRIDSIGSITDPVIIQDMLEHATEIYWCWEDLQKMLYKIDGGVIDKYFWIAECEKGLSRITTLTHRLNQYLRPRRYPLDGFE